MLNSFIAFIKKYLPDLDLQAKLTLAIIISFTFGLLLLLASVDRAGNLGGVLFAFITVLLGRVAYLTPLAFFYIGWIVYRLQKNLDLSRDANSRLYWGIILMTGSLCGFLNLFLNIEAMSQMYLGGGLLGFFLYPFLLGPFAKPGGFLMLFSIGFFGFFLVSQLSFSSFVEILKQTAQNPKKFWDLVPDIFEAWKINSEPTSDLDIEPEDLLPEEEKQKNLKLNKKLNSADNDSLREKLMTEIEEQPVKDKTMPKIEVAKNENVNWKLPSFDFLRSNQTVSEAGDIEAKKEIIKNTLENFKIEVEMGEVVTGPTVSQYTFKPANGVKLSTIDSLQRDLALSLAATSLRLEAPILGKSLVGVEIPNKIKSQVRLKDILQTKKFFQFDNPLPVAVGVDVAGKSVISSIAKMPHLLVAGTTGSGKSVWINSLLLSLLYRYSPQDLELILVDMKRVELKLYENVPHLLSPVVTEPQKAVNALKWAVLEMERRYKILEEFGKRNIADFNEFVNTTNIPDFDEKPLPYIVFVIDELGDLMIVAKNEVEPIVVRLTQMSRAVGIHLVLGTQRPDTGVITGLIKANVPTRVAFTVASQVDSRVMIDQGGAEKLLGQGDGMFLSPEFIRPIRFQGCFVEELEVRKVVNFWTNQVQENGYTTNLNPEVVETPTEKLEVPGMTVNTSAVDEKDLFQKVRKFVIQKQSASTSMLQTAFGIGYPKARKIISQLEEEGVVGPANGSKPREVYVEAV